AAQSRGVRRARSEARCRRHRRDQVDERRRRGHRVKRLLLVVLAVLPLLGGCGGDDDDGGAITVLAASSLTEAFGEIAGAFSGEVELSFAASSALVEQANAGAPGDVLVTADE